MNEEKTSLMLILLIEVEDDWCCMIVYWVPWSFFSLVVVYNLFS